MTMKPIRPLSRFLAFALALLASAFGVSAATYQDGYGQGNQGDNAFFGAGLTLGVTGSVNSNSLYYCTSPKGDGAPRITSVLMKAETPSTLKFYISTNYWVCASNQPANTNIIWLTSTNSGLSTNDLLVLQNYASDAQSLLVLSGVSTDGAGLVYTNAAGYNGVKVFTGSTNTIVSGDRLFKMTPIFSVTPLASSRITNNIVLPWTELLQLNDINGGVNGSPLALIGRAGWPTATVLTYSNAASLYVSGDYYRRAR